MPYSEIRKLVTCKKKSEILVEHLNNQGFSQENLCRQLLAKYQDVFQGIGKHKYREVRLDIDKTVKPVI